MSKYFYLKLLMAVIGVAAVPSVGATALQNAVPLTDQSAAQGEQLLYAINVPVGATNLVISISGGTGDADLYTRFGSPPSLVNFECRPWLAGNDESCTISLPKAGTYYVMLNAFEAFSGVSIEATWDINALQNGAPLTDQSAAQGEQLLYTVVIPVGAVNLVISISGGTGDADLYTQFGSPPTTSDYNCRPWLHGNDESCTFASPQAGTYHIMLNAFEAFSGVSIEATWSTGAVALQNGVPLTGQFGVQGEQLFYTVDIPADATNLVITTSEGTGNEDLYAKFDFPPTLFNYDCRSHTRGNDESCTFASPQAGTYYVMLNGYAAFSGVSVKATWTP